MERPSATFCNGKYSIVDDFCCVEFLAYYTLENKPSKNRGYQPDEFDDYLMRITMKSVFTPQKLN